MAAKAGGLAGVRRSRRRAYVVLGRPGVFWPVLLFGAVLASGSGPRGSGWMWSLVLLVAGPGLGLAIWLFQQGPHTGRQGHPLLGRVAAHLRGSSSP